MFVFFQIYEHNIECFDSKTARIIITNNEKSNKSEILKTIKSINEVRNHVTRVWKIKNYFSTSSQQNLIIVKNITFGRPTFPFKLWMVYLIKHSSCQFLTRVGIIFILKRKKWESL